MKEVISAKTVWKERSERAPQIKPARSLSAAELFVCAASLVVLFIIVCAIIPGAVAPYAPTQMFTDHILQPPSTAHLLGTDYFGRDVFSLVVYGSRDSLFIGIASVLAGGILGGTIGALSGYIGGGLIRF